MKIKIYIWLLVCCLTTAASALGSVSNQDDMDANHSVYDVCLLHYTDTTQTFTPTDSLALTNLCAKCPYTEGFVVFRARALYNEIYHVIENFTDECSTSNSSRFANKTSDERIEQQLQVEFYPNPNNGLFTIEMDVETDNLQIKVFDVAGKEIYNSYLKITNYNNTMRLDLKNGIYFVEIQSNSSHTKIIKKLVINN